MILIRNSNPGPFGVVRFIGEKTTSRGSALNISGCFDNEAETSAVVARRDVL